jgi:FKBP-type peptidyl-prolyl cis-trans isomerase
LKVTTLKPGAGPAAVKGDTVVVYYIGVRSRDGVEFDNNYDSGQPFSVQLGAGSVIKGWDQGLIGVQAGSRVQLDIPSALAYGAQAQGDVIGANEDLTFVLDVLAVVPATDPKAEPVLVIKPTKVTELTTDDLVTGTGSTAATSQNVTFNYIFYRADTGAKLFSSWSSQPASIPLVHDGQLDCLIDGLVGMKVGGRREITCPAAKVFGGQGNTSLGIPAGVDLVMVADLLAAY